VPFPVPFAPDVTEIHAALLVATQEQPAPAVTVTVPLVLADVVRFTEAGEIVGEQVVPAWMTVNDCPAIVTVPVRDVVFGFAAISYETAPLPLPGAPAVTVIHGALLVAVQSHPEAAVTVTVPDDAAEVARFTDDGEIVNAQGAPAWLTVNVCPPIVSVPVRDVDAGFAATL
jgi:hypothetical protein